MCCERGILVMVWAVMMAGSAQAQSTRQSTVNGLKGEYFNGPNFEQKAYTRTDPTVDFDWNWQYPAPGVQREYFSVRWTGKLYAPTSGKYRFSATVDDGVRVWVGGKKVIDEWRKQDDSQFIGEISLQGKHYYDLRIEYYNDWKGSIVNVFWETPEERKAVANFFGYSDPPRKTIPSKYLFSRPVTVSRPTMAPSVANTTAKPALPKSTVIKATVAPKTAKPKTLISAANSTKPTPKLAAVKAPKLAAVSKPASITQATVSTAMTRPINTFEKLESGQTMVLQNVLFQQSSYVLLPESYAELNRLIKALEKHPNAQIEISGHTDNIGDQRLNQSLSEFRAKVVMNYLVRHGITEDRLSAKGYGGLRPVTSNKTEGDRAQNRRVEFVVR